VETWLITGGAGFIGCNFVRLALNETPARIVILDKLTYAGSLENLAEVRGDARVTFVEGDIADPATVAEAFRAHRPRVVVNFAAESHVDRSIDSPRNFVTTNVLGTFELLDAAAASCRRARAGPLAVPLRSGVDRRGLRRARPVGAFSETTAYAPNSPYAATKAAADHLVRAYGKPTGSPP
jgi:dTDP-glucose 4,6-dehydratase